MIGTRAVVPVVLVALAAGFASAATEAIAAERFGTEGDDTLVGSPDADRLFGQGGTDRLYGRRGRDLLDGGAGPDRVHGGRGNDQLAGQDGNDRLFGEKGADRLTGGPGDDDLFVGAGRDVAEGGPGDDRIYAKTMRDIDGRADRAGDRLRGGRGADTIFARDGEADRIWCGPGNDRVVIDFKDELADASCETVERGAPAAPGAISPVVRRAAVKWAVGKIGVREQPDGSNTGPQIDEWQARLGLHGALWCGVFVHEAYWRAGRDLHDSVASTDFIRGSAEADENGFAAVALGRLKRGDLVLLDFPGGDGDDHVAIVTRGLKDGHVRTVDGNSGNRVKRNVYSTSDVALGVRVTG